MVSPDQSELTIGQLALVRIKAKQLLKNIALVTGWLRDLSSNFQIAEITKTSHSGVTV